MTELKVNLDFACHACHRPVGVTEWGVVVIPRNACFWD